MVKHKPSLKFSRVLRLLTPNDFTFVFHKPQQFRTSHITILGRINTLGHPRIGLTLSKKHIKLAHDRNRIKRLTRESFRLHQHILPSMDFVIISKKSMATLDHHDIKKALEKLWHHSCQYRN